MSDDIHYFLVPINTEFAILLNSEIFKKELEPTISNIIYMQWTKDEEDNLKNPIIKQFDSESNAFYSSAR